MFFNDKLDNINQSYLCDIKIVEKNFNLDL